MQAIQADTAGAVTAIGEISEIIGRINDFQTTIASAVEEQTVTTTEMSRNVSEAAEAGTRVAETDRAATHLAGMSGNLRRIVDRFRL